MMNHINNNQGQKLHVQIHRCRKGCDQVQCLSKMKVVKKLGVETTCFHTVEVIPDKPIDSIITHEGRTENSLNKSGLRKVCLLFLLCSIVYGLS